MRVTASKRRDGSAQTHVVHTTIDGKKKRSERGATEDHPTLDAAQARTDALVANLVKMGWKPRQPRGGFVRKPDSFDAAHLPGSGFSVSSRKK